MRKAVAEQGKRKVVEYVKFGENTQKQFYTRENYK